MADIVGVQIQGVGADASYVVHDKTLEYKKIVGLCSQSEDQNHLGLYFTHMSTVLSELMEEELAKDI